MAFPIFRLLLKPSAFLRCLYMDFGRPSVRITINPLCAIYWTHCIACRTMQLPKPEDNHGRKPDTLFPARRRRRARRPQIPACARALAGRSADNNWKYGADLAYLKSLVEYWRDGYDWRKHEAKLNAFKQFKVKLAGIDVHYIREEGKGPKPMPLLISHGWPGSVHEFHKILPMLTDPGALRRRSRGCVHRDRAFAAGLYVFVRAEPAALFGRADCRRVCRTDDGRARFQAVCRARRGLGRLRDFPAGPCLPGNGSPAST